MEFAAVRLRDGENDDDDNVCCGGTEGEVRDGETGKKRRVKKIEDCVRVRKRKNERGEVFAEAELRVIVVA